MSRRYFALLVIALTTLLFGCSKDAEVTAFATELDTTSAEIVKKVEGGKDPSAGVDDAQKYLDGKKADLKSKYKELENVRGFQVKEETMKKLTDAVTNSIMKVSGLQIKYMEKTMSDKAFKAKLEKLVKDYESILTE